MYEAALNQSVSYIQRMHDGMTKALARKISDIEASVKVCFATDIAVRSHILRKQRTRSSPMVVPIPLRTLWSRRSLT